MECPQFCWERMRVNLPSLINIHIDIHLTRGSSLSVAPCFLHFDFYSEYTILLALDQKGQERGGEVSLDITNSRSKVSVWSASSQ